MKWQHPPIAKIHEALGAIADGRISTEGNTAQVYSSSRNKFYTVSYDPHGRAIMANDNGSFYKGYLGYPAIAFLMLTGELPYDKEVAELLKGIAWKDLNQRFKNDFGATIDHILNEKNAEERARIKVEVERIDKILRNKTFNLLGQKTKPPDGY